MLLLTAAVTQSTARDGAGDDSLASTSQSTAPATYLVATITPVHKPDATLDESRAFVHARILAARAARSQSLVPASSPHESTGSPHDVPALSPPQESTGSPQDVPASSSRESTGSPVLTNRYTPPEEISTQADDDLTSSHSPPTVYVPPAYLCAHYQNVPSRSKALKKWSKGLIEKYSSYFRRNECPAGSTSPNDDDDSVAADNPVDKDDDDDEFVKIRLDKLKKKD